MRRQFLIAGMIAISFLAHAGEACAQALPPTLPLNGTVTADTCVQNPNDPCDSNSYPSPIATSRFTLDEPSTVNFTMSGSSPGFDPVIYLSGGECDDTDCGPDLSAGTYCVTVTASPASVIGSCGSFTLAVETVGGVIFGAGFDD